MIRRILDCRRRSVLISAAALIALIAVTDWRVELNVTLGFLYLFPLVLLGTKLNWPSVIAVAIGCTVLSDRLDPFSAEMQGPRLLLIFLTLATTGLLSLSVTRA